MTEQSLILESLPIKALSEALQKYYQEYQGNPRKRSNVVNPFRKIANYVYAAWKAGLDKKEECAYTGSLLIFSVQKEIGIKYASDVSQVNQLYLAGLKMANAIWTKLDDLKSSGSKVDDQTFENLMQQASEELWNRFQFEYTTTVNQVTVK